MAEADLPDDASRRTQLADERTYLAWSRTGLAAGLRRLRVVRKAIERGGYAHLDDRVVIALAGVGVLLGVLTIGVLAYQL